MTIAELKQKVDKGEINIFTNEKFLGEGIKKPFNAQFMTSNPNVTERKIKYKNKAGDDRDMNLASVNLHATDQDGLKSPIQVTVNNQMLSIFESPIKTENVYGIEGEGIVSGTGNEYNRYDFSLSPMLAVEPKQVETPSK